jgi:hypothetical protein
VYLSFDVLNVFADVALARLLGTLCVVAGHVGFFTVRQNLSTPVEPRISAGALSLARRGSASVPSASAVVLTFGCVAAGVALWVR